MERETDEIESEYQRAASASYGPSKWSGMTYEQGVRNALQWVLGDSDDKPMDD